MYAEIIKQLIEPILLEDINEVEIRELIINDQEIEVIILMPSVFFKKIVGKNGNIIEALRTLVNAKAQLNDQKVKLVINEL